MYAYEDVTGSYVTYVGATRYVFCEPLPEPVPASDVRASVNRMMAVQRIVEASSREPIVLAYDGRTYYDDTLEALLERMVGLRDAGYRVPGCVIANLQKEIALAYR